MLALSSDSIGATAADTAKVTATVTDEGFASGAVIVMFAEYVPATSWEGSATMSRRRGADPLCGETESHGAEGTVDTEKSAPGMDEETDSSCRGAGAPALCPVKVRLFEET